jgi:hypothetical protein
MLVRSLNQLREKAPSNDLLIIKLGLVRLGRSNGSVLYSPSSLSINFCIYLTYEITEDIYSGEEKPTCSNCQKQGEACDYSIRLNWEGRTFQRTVISPKRHSDSGIKSSLSSLLEPTTVEKLTSARSMDVVEHGTPSTDTEGWASDRSQRQVASPQEAHVSHYLPSTPVSLLPDSPASYGGINEKRKSEISHDTAFGDIRDPIRAPISGRSFLDNPVEKTGSSPQPSQNQLISSLSGPTPLMINGFTSPEYESNTVTQPTSYLRQSFGELPRTSVNMPMHDTYNSPLPKRQKHTPTKDSSEHSIIFQSPVGPGEVSSPPALSVDKLRRVSVNSLLSRTRDAPTKMTRIPFHDSLQYQQPRNSENSWYGMDPGYPDLDLHQNNDFCAIETSSLIPLQSVRPQLLKKNTAYVAGGYYENPVPVEIPRSLQPLPPVLRDNQINLMYFHHFINHTSRLLVPHNCEENPLRTVLPSCKK